MSRDLAMSPSSILQTCARTGREHGRLMMTASTNDSHTTGILCALAVACLLGLSAPLATLARSRVVRREISCAARSGHQTAAEEAAHLRAHSLWSPLARRLRISRQGVAGREPGRETAMPSVNVKVIETHTSQIPTSENDSDKGGNLMSPYRLLQL